MTESLNIIIDSIATTRDLGGIAFSMNPYVKVMYGGETHKTAIKYEGGTDAKFG